MVLIVLVRIILLYFEYNLVVERRDCADSAPFFTMSFDNARSYKIIMTGHHARYHIHLLGLYEDDARMGVPARACDPTPSRVFQPVYLINKGPFVRARKCSRILDIEEEQK